MKASVSRETDKILSRHKQSKVVAKETNTFYLRCSVEWTQGQCPCSLTLVWCIICIPSPDNSSPSVSRLQKVLEAFPNPS